MPRGDRRRHSGAARADHQHVAFVGFLFVARHAIRLVSFLGQSFGWGRIGLSIARVSFLLPQGKKGKAACRQKRARPPQFPVSNEHVAPPPAFCLISAGSSVQVSFERLSNTDPAAPSDGTPAMASVAKISLARRPVMVCLAPLKVSSQERAVMSTLLTRQTILSAVTE